MRSKWKENLLDLDRDDTRPFFTRITLARIGRKRRRHKAKLRPLRKAGKNGGEQRPRYYSSFSQGLLATYVRKSFMHTNVTLEPFLKLRRREKEEKEEEEEEEENFCDANVKEEHEKKPQPNYPNKRRTRFLFFFLSRVWHNEKEDEIIKSRKERESKVSG